MQTTRTRAVLLAIPFLFAALNLFGQGWERAYGDADSDGFYDVLPMPDGGYLAVGRTQTSLAPIHYDLLLVKTDADGLVDWSRQYSDTLYSFLGNSIVPTADGGFLIGGTALTESIPRGYLLKTDNLGNREWQVTSPQDSVWGRKALQLLDGTFALAGSAVHEGNGNGADYDFYAMRVSADGGNVVFSKQYGGVLYDDCQDMVETNGGGLLLAGLTNSFGNGHYDVYLVEVDTMGNVNWSKTIGTPNAELAYAIATTADGNYVITGQTEAQAAESEDVFLAKIDPSGNTLWWKTYQKASLDIAFDVQETSSGNFVLAGNTRADINADRNAFLLMATSSGDEYWKRDFGGVNGDGAYSVILAGNGGYVMAGYTRSFGQGSADAYLVRTDQSGVANSCYIVGNVASNNSFTCGVNNFAAYLDGFLVEVEGDITYFGTTDEFGNYSVPVKEGNYNVRLINPSPYWTPCADSVDVAVVGTFDTAVVNYSLYVDTLCAYMSVDMSALTMRRCFQNVYSIDYCNLGSMAAEPALVEVAFDPYLNIDSTSIPWAYRIGNTYMFDVGNVAPFECGQFKAYYTVDCDSTVLGQSHCSEAHIYPDEYCQAFDPMWDGSSIELDAVCEGDSVVFTIMNMGEGDMAGPLDFIVIEDVIIGLQGGFELKSGEDTTFSLPATGSTLRLQADQSPGHPGHSKPCITVEGCGIGGEFSTGYVIQYPLNDADLFVDTDCQENTGSFDPNDKQGFPMGYGGEHFIEPDTDIEYMIRFQNTGTDTAFTVVVRDTLSPSLDPTSIQVGGGSHSFRYELYGTGILKFTFENIMLPDSNINEAASHGFVKFKIKQQKGLSLGTKIKNSAAIYFDYNQPIITNTTFHTVGTDFIVQDPGTTAVSELLLSPSVLVHPNPFLEKATFELKNVQGKDFRFHLFDLSGRQVRDEAFDQTIFHFERKGLAGGIYFYRILGGGPKYFSGKIILK
ncbi:MAG TPA: hypothetical protein ENJ95_16655 [Bacteroidetes bacterium]|nr:hypothetical protein [Bacteroidota bacterium]